MAEESTADTAVIDGSAPASPSEAAPAPEGSPSSPGTPLAPTPVSVETSPLLAPSAAEAVTERLAQARPDLVPEPLRVTTGTEQGNLERQPVGEPPTGADTGSLLDWRGALPLPLRNDPTLAKYGSLEAAGKALIEMQSFIGRSIQIPQAEAPQEEWNRVWEKLGWPKTPGEYGVTLPEMPEGLPPISDAFRDRILIEGHAMGLTPKQMQGWIDLAARVVVEGNQMQAQEMAASRAAGQQELQRQFGADAPRRLEKARLFLAQTGGGRFGGEYGVRAAEKWLESPLANDPDIIATFADAFDLTSEGQFIDSGFASLGTTPEALQAELNELTAKANNGALPMAQRVAASDARRPLFAQLAAMQEAQNRRGAGGLPRR